MNAPHFNNLSPEQDERLALLAEECAEVIQAIAKIQRHGYESHHPDSGVWNRAALEKEIGDVEHAVSMMVDAQDLHPSEIASHREQKARKIVRYLHHQQSA